MASVSGYFEGDTLPAPDGAYSLDGATEEAEELEPTAEEPKGRRMGRRGGEDRPRFGERLRGAAGAIFGTVTGADSETKLPGGGRYVTGRTKDERKLRKAQAAQRRAEMKAARLAAQAEKGGSDGARLVAGVAALAVIGAMLTKGK